MAPRSPKPAAPSSSPRSAVYRQAAVVRSYLESLRSAGPGRGRRRSAEAVQRRLQELQSVVPADVIAELRMAQERIDLTAELVDLATQSDPSALEAEFIAVAKAYAVRTGVSYAAWRAVGVPAATLKAAGIAR